MYFIDVINHYLNLLSLSPVTKQEEELFILWGYSILKELLVPADFTECGNALQTLVYYRKSNNNTLHTSPYILDFILMRLKSEKIENPFKGEDAKPYFVGV